MRRSWSVLVAGALLAAACQSSDPVADPVADAFVATPSPDFDQVALDEAIDRFLATRSSSNADSVVELMGASGDPRYVAWLVDIIRSNVSNVVSVSASEALERLTGLAGTGAAFNDAQLFGSFQQTQGIDPGPGYREWKIALYTVFDSEFGPLLASVATEVELSRIHFGGVPRAGIPELNDPARVGAIEATWMIDDELVMGAVVDGVAVAYPLRIVLHHELVNDTVGGRPVALVYCTLCRTGLLFDRDVDGRVLEFETSGLLENSNKIMVDRQTDTLWHHLEGEAFAGPLDGSVLEQLPVVTITWADWIAEHPDTVVLAIPEPVFFDDPERPPIAYSYEPGDAYSSYYDGDAIWFPIVDTPATFPLKDEVIGITFDDEQAALAVHLPSIADGPPRWFGVGDRAVVVVPTSAGARVYEATGSEQRENGAIVDLSIIDGLDVVVAEQSFWFAWWSNHQQTEVWSTE